MIKHSQNNKILLRNFHNTKKTTPNTFSFQKTILEILKKIQQMMELLVILRSQLRKTSVILKLLHKPKKNSETSKRQLLKNLQSQKLN